MLSKSIKKLIPYRPFHRAIDESLKIPEKCWPFLYLNLPEYRSSGLPAHPYKMVITTVCVQIDNWCMIKTFRGGRGGGWGGGSSGRCLNWGGGGWGVIKGSFQKHLKIGGG